MSQHPQATAFVRAAELMHANRYWARAPHEQLEFLLALHDVLTEVCFHLDRNHVLNEAGLRAFADASDASHVPRLFGSSAGTILLPALDQAILTCLAALEDADDT